MTPADYEAVTVYRTSIEYVNGRRTAGDLQEVGQTLMLIAPNSIARATDTGRIVTNAGYDLYRRGHADIDIRIGDVIDIRGQQTTVTESPVQWKRGDRVIGWHWHTEIKEDQ